MHRDSHKQVELLNGSGGPGQRQTRKEVARLAGVKCVHEAFGWFESHEREMADQQLEVTAIPAPPFRERQRSEWMLSKFIECGLQQAHMDAVCNVIGVLPGAVQEPYVLVSAHVDTVFSETQLEVRRDGERLVGPGIADNSAGLVALLAIAAAMQATGIKTRLPLLFLANVGEEGEGNLRGMRHFFEDPQWRTQIHCMLALDGAGTDTIVTEALGSRRFEVSISGPGGHSWSDFGTANPIVLLARVIERLSRISLPENPRTTVNVGIIEGGTSVNAIPESALMRVDLRSTDPARIAAIEAELQAILNEVVNGAEKPSGLQSRVRVIGDRPAAELTDGAFILEALRAVDSQLGIKSHVHCASTDANIPLSLGVQALAIGAGGTGARAHTLQEWFIARGRTVALKRILLTILTIAGLVE
jgi:acetylornithine deacetylase/succinyl-diaminopimelate desuccinylase-like protein